jgi:BRCA1-associated protein
MLKVLLCLLNFQRIPSAFQRLRHHRHADHASDLHPISRTANSTTSAHHDDFTTNDLMPSYFYHLAFELYPTPKPTTPDSSSPLPKSVFLPPRNTNLFTSPLPIHRVASWGTERPKRQLHWRTKTEDEGSERLKSRSKSFHDLPEEAPPKLKITTPSPVPSGRIVPVRTEQEHRNSLVGPEDRDWRFDAVTIQSIDMVDSQAASGPGRPRGKSQSQSTHAGTSSGGLATRGKFIPSDPKNTDVGWGVVHLYRDAQETPGLYDDTSSSDDGTGEDSQPFNEDECTTLCILAVPSYMTPSDLLGFVGEQTREDVSHFRLIRTGRANKYMVLMKFRDAKKARAWRNDWNGKSFNSMEPEYCHVVFVQSITFQTAAGEQQSSFPDMTNDPFVQQKSQATAKSPSNSTTLESPSSLSASLTTKPLAPPTPNLVELPTCPVCLERMDETTGLLTILCQHVFHCACLEKWRGSGCPVCRYTQNSSVPGLIRSEDAGAENQCSVCSSESNLWICLICGNVGCGRYDSAHAFAHYEATRHSYAMDIATQHVWDYAGDGYVHRLIQNKADGKLVDLPAAAHARYNSGKNPSGGMAALGADMVPREKMEAMGNEYAYLLTSQLDSQRLYFEEQLERAVDKASKASNTAEKAMQHLDSVTKSLEKLQRSHADAQQTIAGLEKDIERTRKRADKADELARKFSKDWREEKVINESLMERVRFLDGKIKDAETRQAQLQQEKNELEEQNRDLSFFISGGEKLKELQEQGEDVVEGRLEVPEEKTEGKGKKKKGRRR